jgi:UDP-N-acetylmuramyl pentapeptide phosphotransferase/UDP-N-acetylglucosamine-1-phosphate transferase
MHQLLNNLSPALVAFATSLLIALLLVITQKWHGIFSLDVQHGIQKFHVHPTPRVGGIAITCGALAAYFAAKAEHQSMLGYLMIAGIPAFLFGLLEDITKRVSVLVRLIATMTSGFIAWLLVGISLTDIGIPLVNNLFHITLFSVLFTAFAIGGVANALNIIDGFNGLASGYSILAMACLAAIAHSVGDTSLAMLCSVLACAIAGFFFLNWPWGKLFLGDGGAYFMGFALAWACVLMVERNDSVSPFSMLLVCSYPVTEVLFSIYRRKMRHMAPGKPDRLHLHSLLMGRHISKHLGSRWANPATGILVVALTTPSLLLAYVLREHTLASIGGYLLVVLCYLTLYARIVKFRWAAPFCFFQPKPR